MTHNETISFHQVTKTYTAEIKRKSVALTGLTFAVTKGEVFGIIGPNGAGKSTALKILMGFVRKDGGNVDLSGHIPGDPNGHHKIGYLPETPCLYTHLKLTDHLHFAGRIAGYTKQQTIERTHELLHMLDLAHAAKIPIRQYSKGMTQRAALAYALFHKPEILILDEPMSGLDPLGRQLVVEIIQEYNDQGHTILFCSHILSDVERICDRIGIMHKGKLATCISPSQLHGQKQFDLHSNRSPLETLFMQTVADINQ